MKAKSPIAVVMENAAVARAMLFVPARPHGLQCGYCAHRVVAAGTNAVRLVMEHVRYAHPDTAQELDAMAPHERNHQTVATPFKLRAKPEWAQ